MNHVSSSRPAIRRPIKRRGEVHATCMTFMGLSSLTKKSSLRAGGKIFSAFGRSIVNLNSRVGAGSLPKWPKVIPGKLLQELTTQEPALPFRPAAFHFDLDPFERGRAEMRRHRQDRAGGDFFIHQQTQAASRPVEHPAVHTRSSRR